MKKLLRYLKPYRCESILGPLFKLLEAALELLVPLVVAAIIDVGIAHSDKTVIIRYCLLLAALGAVGLAFSVTAQYFAAKASVGLATQIRHALFAQSEKLSYSQLDRLGTSSLITRMTSDANQVQSGVNLTLRLLLRSPFVVFGAMAMAFTIDTHIALIFAAVIPVLSLVIFGIMLTCIPLYKKVQQQLDRLLATTRENLTGVRVLRAFCMEKQETEEFSVRNETLTRSQKQVASISALMNPLTYVIINLAILVLIKVGALRVDAGLLTQGAVVALYNYMSQILVELIKFANLIINTTKSVACGNRIQNVLELVPEMEDEPTEESPLPAKSEYRVQFCHAGLRYAGDSEESVSDICLDVRPGETIGIIGGTGSGKTSMVSLISRFYDVSSGSVLVDGVDVRRQKLSELRQKVGFVPQKAVLFAGTIRENLLWGCPNATDEELWTALRVAQAEDVVTGKEQGLDSLLEQGGRNLSGGQRQRLTIARALVGRKPILVLDDSASALDFATDAALRKALRTLEPPPTVFIVSQRTSSLQYADAIVVLDDGRIAGLGCHADLLQSCPVYREIYDSQFKKEAART